MPDRLHTSIADAFRSWPKSPDDDTLVGLRLSDAIRLATAAAAPHVAEAHAEAAGYQAQLAFADAAIAHSRDHAQAAIAAAAAAYEQHTSDLGDRLAGLEHAAAGRTARTAALEAVLVQAKARWDHEGGPDAIRDAIASAEAASA